jgi:hypothetical protein
VTKAEAWVRFAAAYIEGGSPWTTQMVARQADHMCEEYAQRFEFDLAAPTATPPQLVDNPDRGVRLVCVECGGVEYTGAPYRHTCKRCTAKECPQCGEAAVPVSADCPEVVACRCGWSSDAQG